MTAETPDKTIFRRRRSRYTSISNTPLRDRSLALDAVGFLACIMSLPEDWDFNRAWARKRFDIGREKLDRIIKDLTAAGYIRRMQEREADGRMGASIYIFTDEPGDFGDDEDAPPAPEKPLPGNPAAGQSAPTNNLETTNEKSVLADDVGETRTAARAAGSPVADASAATVPDPGSAAGVAGGVVIDRRAEIAARLKALANAMKMPGGAKRETPPGYETGRRHEGSQQHDLGQAR